MNKSILILTAVYLFFALPLSFMDAKKFRISLPVVALGAILLIVTRFFALSEPLVPVAKNLAFALVSSFLLYFGTRVLSGEGLGWGDVFFGMYTSLYTGFYANIIAAVFAALLGILYYLFLSAIQKFKKRTFVHRPLFAIPFVPFITAGAVLVFVLWGVLA